MTTQYLTKIAQESTVQGTPDVNITYSAMEVMFASVRATAQTVTFIQAEVVTTASVAQELTKIAVEVLMSNTVTVAGTGIRNLYIGQ